MIEYYSERLRLEGSAFSLIEHEHAMVAVVYKVTKADGQVCILKICPDERHFHREVLFMNRLSDKLPVPHVIDVAEPKAILMEYIPGRVLEPADIDEKMAFECGKWLAKIHQNRCSGYGDLIKPSLCDDPSLHFTDKFEEGLRECSQVLPQELLEKCRQFYKAHLGLLSKVDGPCIIHRDYRPGNLMLHEGKIRGIIDWSSARSGFAEEDLCSVWPHRKSFLEGYASVRPVPEFTSMLPLLMLSKAVACVGFTIRRGTWKTKDALFYERNRNLIESILELPQRGNISPATGSPC